MPPYLSIPHYHLSKLPVTTKVALTCFTLTLTAAMAFVAFAVYAERTGYRTQGAKLNYLGDEKVREMGEAVDEKVMVQAKSKRELYDIVHPHSFLMPVIYFILCHLFEMSFAPRWLKIGIYVLAAVSMMAVIFAPVLIAAAPAFAALLAPAVVVMLLAFAGMALSPTIQMWVVRA